MRQYQQTAGKWKITHVYIYEENETYHAVTKETELKRRLGKNNVSVASYNNEQWKRVTMISYTNNLPKSF